MARNGLRRWRTIGLLIAYSAAYWAWVLRNGATRLLWFDEILTVNIVRQPDLATLWKALLRGADGCPPLYYLAARACGVVLGDGPVAVRLPAMAGVYALGLGVAVFVARRCGAVYAWAALLIPLSTAAGPYAYEARPYGLVLGALGLMLVAWQAAADRRSRWLALPMLSLGMAAALASHYYAVLLVLPFLAGEAVRIWGRRRIDWGVAVALISGMTVLIPLWPLVRALRAQFTANFWAPPGFLSIPQAYDFLFGHALAGTILVAIMIGLFSWRRPVVAADDRPRVEGEGLAPHEWAVAVALLALPFAGMALALAVTGALADRYLLPTTAGLAIAGPALVRKLAEGRRAWGFILAACATISAPLSQYWDVRDAQWEYIPPNVLIHPLVPYRQDVSPPIAVTDPLRFLQLHHYAPPEIARRTIYLSPGHRTVDKNLDAVAPWMGLTIESTEAFADVHRGERIILYASFKDEQAPPLIFRSGGLSMGFIDEHAYSGILQIP